MKPYTIRAAKPYHENRWEVMHGKDIITKTDKLDAELLAMRLNAAYENGVKDTTSQTGEITLDAAAAKVGLRPILARDFLDYPEDGDAREAYVYVEERAAQGRWAPWVRTEGGVLDEAANKAHLQVLNGSWAVDPAFHVYVPLDSP